MSCKGCKEKKFTFDFTMAFQPIYDVSAARIWGYEALVRGAKGEGAQTVLSSVSEDNKYSFDQSCRVKAIQLASRIFPKDESLKLSINFMPGAVYEPVACLRATLNASQQYGFPLSSMMFEFTEGERVDKPDHLVNIIREYRKHGFITGIDDFGSGYAGLGLLVDFQPDLIKVDMRLIRDIDKSISRKVVVSAIVNMSKALGIDVLAEGIETKAEFLALKELGIVLYQGYWFAKPAFESLPRIELDVGS